MPADLVPAQQHSMQPRLPGTEPTITDIISAAIADPNVDPARLNQFLEFKLRVDAIAAEQAFNTDFAAAMIEMPRIHKLGVKDMGTKGAIPYARYEDVDAAVRPIETRHGFARTFSTRVTDKPGCIMVLRLTHRAGHSITSERYCRPDPGPGRNDTQAEGSGESYGRRYLTLALWNIVTVGADDDANSADPISEEQALGIRTMLDHLAMTPPLAEKFWAWAQVPSKRPEDIQRRAYEKIHRWLSDRCKGAKHA